MVALHVIKCKPKSSTIRTCRSGNGSGRESHEESSRPREEKTEVQIRYQARKTMGTAKMGKGVRWKERRAKEGDDLVMHIQYGR